MNGVVIRDNCSNFAVTDLSIIERVTVSSSINVDRMMNKCSKLEFSHMNVVGMRNKCSRLAVTDLSNIERVTVSSGLNFVRMRYECSACYRY